MAREPWVPRPLRRPLAPLRRALDWLLYRLPLQSLVAHSERRFARQPEPPRDAMPQPLHWAPGISLIVPERGGGELLAQCLAAAHAALAEIDEPVEVIVVVNGSPRADYAALETRFPAVQWLWFDAPLGFTRAVLAGVAQARFGAIYLLNNDMRLEPGALRSLLPWRGPAVFALASQILFPDDGRRREETGWTFMPQAEGLPAPWHAESRHGVVRGTVWAGAGSALYHAGLLRELLPGSLPYDPFYWEDVDLGLRAWQRGYESLYCPGSRALHLHRVTVMRYFPEAEVTRIFERNRLQLQLRHPFPLQPLAPLLARLRALDAATLRELGHWRALRTLWRVREQTWRAPFRDLDRAGMPLSSHRRIARDPILWVSPFALLPPRHGGALRTHRLAQALAREHDLILLSDERGLHGEPDHRAYAAFAAVYLVDGRPEPPPEQASDRIARMRSHAHPALQLELRRLVALHRPRLVLVEHMELAGLVDALGPQRPPCVLNLQDVLLQPDDPAQRAADAAERTLIGRFEGVVVCSPEDQALLGGGVLVANGCDATLADGYQPSAGAQILFAAPFRAAINWQAAVEFLRLAWPAIRAAVPDASLTLLGGPGAPARALDHAAFAQPGVEVLEQVEDVRPLLARAALTINPQCGLRGSSLKVLESLAAGRVCVSTIDGARGHRQHGFAGLVECAEVAGFASAIIPLLRDPARRHAIEAPDAARLAACSWEACAQPLQTLVRSLVGRPPR